jgi:hypothetical protein
MAWRLDLVAQSELPLDRDKTSEDAFAVLTFETALCTQPRNLVTKSANLCGNLARPAIRNTFRSTGIRPGAAPSSTVARKLWNGFNTHLLP